MRLFAAILEQVSGGKKEKSKKVRMVPGTDVPYENWIQGWAITEREKRKSKSIPDLGNIIRDEIIYSESKKKEVPDYKKEYPYNIEFGDGRTKKEMDKMQEELMECGCLSDCGCKE